MMLNGFILINKEKGISSSKVDFKIKKILDLKKVGHLGTLDPLAEGLLVIGINKATKTFKYFDDLDKKYILRLRVGDTSDSLDYEKEISSHIDTNLLGMEEYIDNELKKWISKYNQYPPIYSSIKVSGKKLYDYALKGIGVDINPRKVEIYDIRRISEIEVINNSSFFDIYMHVSKGFYVRSFAKDFCESINTIGMADNIKRIGVGKFKLEDSYTIEFVENGNYQIINPLNYLDYKIIKIDKETYKKVLTGSQLNFDFIQEYIILEFDNKFVAIYKYDKDLNIYRIDLLLDV